MLSLNSLNSLNSLGSLASLARLFSFHFALFSSKKSQTPHFSIVSFQFSLYFPIFADCKPNSSIMKQILEISYNRFSSLEELGSEDYALVKEAEEATKNANAAYSNFHVGAAVRLKSGMTLHASNFESEVYPAGLCAERSLLFYVEANYANDPIEALAIASDPSERECYPCGQCRQVIVDVERRQKSPIRVIMTGAGTATVVDSAELLLPFTFKL